jgi:hypothetical protein
MKHHNFPPFLGSSHKIKLLQISAIEIENTLKLHSLQSKQLINKKIPFNDGMLEVVVVIAAEI